MAWSDAARRAAAEARRRKAIGRSLTGNYTKTIDRFGHPTYKLESERQMLSRRAKPLGSHTRGRAWGGSFNKFGHWTPRIKK